MKKLNSMFRRTEKGVGVNVFNNFRFCPVISGFYLLPSPFFKSKVKVCFAEFIALTMRLSQILVFT